MTTIEFRCKACRTRYSVKEKMAGKKTKCKKCQAEMEVPYPPLELPDEVTSGGSVVYRHEEGVREFELASGDEHNIQLISNHIEQHVGKIDDVLHEVVSDLIHVDIHVVPATDQRPYLTLVTSGMSDRRMTPPPEAEEYGFAELVICLPPDWPLAHKDLEDENNYWPVRWLKILARFPHEYGTWLSEGHSIPNGDPPKPFAANTNFCGWLIYPPLLVPKEFRQLRLDGEKTINFFAAFPVYEGEMNLKLKKGTKTLVQRFQKDGVTELLDLNRKDTSKRGRWPFG